MYRQCDYILVTCLTFQFGMDKNVTERIKSLRVLMVTASLLYVTCMRNITAIFHHSNRPCDFLIIISGHSLVGDLALLTIWSWHFLLLSAIGPVYFCFKVVGWYFHFIQILIEHSISKLLRPWSDAAFCGVWSGSALFAYVPQKRRLA